MRSVAEPGPVPDLRDRILHPRPGWLSLGLLMVMALSVAWSVQEVGWLEQAEFAAPIAAWAVVIGAFLGILRPPIVVSLPLAALAGVGLVMWAVGGEYFVDLSQLDRLLALRLDLIEWTRIVIRTGYPPQMSPYAIGLGVLMFATAFTAAHTAYRHHKVLDAIALLGTAIVVNMARAEADLVYLILFVIAALLLWLRGTLAERQDGWQRRRVSETLEVPGAIMRSGVLFAGASVLLAWVLTTVAVAAPLTGAWRSLDGVWTGVRDQLEGVFGSLTNPNARISGNSFGPAFTVAGEWVSNDDEALVLAADRALYLRTTTYDHYTGRGWAWSDQSRREVAADEALFVGPTSERPTVVESVTPAQIAIEMSQTIGRNLFTAGSPIQIHAPVVIVETGGAPVLAGIEHAQPLSPGQAYELEVALSRATQAELGTAGTDYPDEVSALYLDTTGITDRVAALAQEVIEEAGAENDFERAQALADYLRRDPSFTYSTDPPVDPPGGQDIVDFFLFDPAADRTGYCEYFASAMALMARSVGLPARVAVGFAPGERQVDGTYLYRESNAHAWVEIYFPKYGWQIFESTKSISNVFRAAGDPTTGAPPVTPGLDDPLSTNWDIILRDAEDNTISVLPSPGELITPQPGGEDETSDTAGNAMILLGLMAAAGVALFLRMRYTRRQWRLLPAGDRAWRQLTAAAERAGVGQRPSETIYEYAGWLEEQLPRQGEPIHIVADGKVWQSYSGRRLTATSNLRLEAALRALRFPMLRLTMRHWARRLFRPDSPG